MTDPPDSGPPMRLTAAQVSQVLKRAAEIDARGDSMTVEELERVASEAGIDPRATRTAIAEVISEEMPIPAPDPRPPEVTAARTGNPAFPSAGRIIGGGALGVVCGFLFALSPGSALVGFAVTGFYLLLRAVHAMKRGSQFDFQIQNFSLWFGFVLSMVVAHGAEGAMFTFLGWVFTSFLGGLLVRFGPREETPAEDVPLIESGGR